MDALRELEIDNNRYQSMGRIEAGATTRDRQSPGEQYQAFRRRVSPTDNLAITFMPAGQGTVPGRQPARQPNRLQASTLFAITGAVLLLAMVLFLIAGVPALLAVVLILPAMMCFYQGRKSLIHVTRLAIRQLLR